MGQIRGHQSAASLSRVELSGPSAASGCRDLACGDLWFQRMALASGCRRRSRKQIPSHDQVGHGSTGTCAPVGTPLALAWGDQPAVIMAACAVSGINSMISRAACGIVGRTTRWGAAIGREAPRYLSGRLRSWARRRMGRPGMLWEDPLCALTGNWWWEAGKAHVPRTRCDKSTAWWLGVGVRGGEMMLTMWRRSALANVPFVADLSLAQDAAWLDEVHEQMRHLLPAEDAAQDSSSLAVKELVSQREHRWGVRNLSGGRGASRVGSIARAHMSGQDLSPHMSVACSAWYLECTYSFVGLASHIVVGTRSPQRQPSRRTGAGAGCPWPPPHGRRLTRRSSS